MYKSADLATWEFSLAAFLIVSGLATFWWSSDLMIWLIWLVGEEYALGAKNVVHVEGGGKLLTNPSAMIAWTTPFWLLGLVQISSAVALVWLWISRRQLTKRST